MFGGQVKKLAAGLGLLSAASISGVTLALGRMIKVQATAIEEMSRFADRIGIATENLQTLEVAAKLTGVSVNQLRLGLQRMTRRISEAAQETGEAKAAIKELGLDARRLAEMDPGEAFLVIADRMNLVENQSDRVRLAFKLFDSEGVALVNTMALGSKRLRELNDELERMGFILTSEGIENAQGLNEQLVLLSAQFEALKNAWATEAAPELTKFLRVWRETIEATQEADNWLQKYWINLTAVFRLFKRDYTPAVEEARDATEELAESFELLIGQLNKAATDPSLTDWIKDMADLVEDIEDRIRDEEERLKRLAERIAEDVMTPQERFNKAIKELDELLKRELITQETYNRKLRQLQEELERATEKQEDLNEEIEKFIEIAPEAAGPSDPGAFRQARINRLAATSPRVRAERERDKRLEMIADWVKKILELTKNPPPQPLIWDN
jgi:uncharacterized phage infection (PIP) family protein YhgE